MLLVKVKRQVRIYFIISLATPQASFSHKHVTKRDKHEVKFTMA